MPKLDVFTAAKQGDFNAVEHYFGAGTHDIDVRDFYSNTVLYYAAMCGHATIVRYMLGLGARYESRDILSALTEEIRQMLKRGPFIFAEEQMKRRRPTHRAPALSPSLVKRLMGGKNAAAADIDGMSLHGAVKLGNVPLAHSALMGGADPNELDARGCSPMHFALLFGHYDVAELLNGAGSTSLEYKLRAAVGSDEFSDIRFRTSDDRVVFAHKFMLLHNCPRFMSLVERAEAQQSVAAQALPPSVLPSDSAPSAEGDAAAAAAAAVSELNINLNRETLLSLLEYIYTGYTVVNKKNVAVLTRLSEKLEETRLQQMVQLFADKSTLVDPLDTKARLERLLNSPEFSDVSFVAEEKPIHAHRLILSVRSEYFKVMFHSGMLESHAHEIAVDEQLSYNAFLAILRYMYMGVISLDGVVLEEVFGLMALADMYMVDGMRCYCEQYILENGRLDKHSVCAVFLFARANHSLALQTACIEFMSRHMAEVVEQPEYCSLPENEQRALYEALSPEAAIIYEQYEKIRRLNANRPAPLDDAPDADEEPSDSAARHRHGRNRRGHRRRW